MVLRKLFRRQPPVGLDSVVVATGGFEGADLQGSGELVGVHLERGKYFALNGGGRHIWELIAEPRSVAEVCDLLEEEYAVERERLEAEVLEFLKALVAHDMAAVVRGSASAADRAAR